MNKELIIEIDRQLLNEEHIILDKQEASEIVNLIKEYDLLKNKYEKLKKDTIKELKYLYNIVSEEKYNHLILSDESDYHHHEYIIAKEKEYLLEELLEFMYNYD